MSDLVKRLRAFDCITMNGCGDELRKEAADEITALRARLDAEKEKHLSFYKSACDWQRRAERAEAALATARRDGFLAGFKASGEGWNGEYPYEGDNPLDDKYFVDVMEREIRALANEAETSARGMP